MSFPAVALASLSCAACLAACGARSPLTLGGDAGAALSGPTVRLVAPLSTSTVTSTSPTLRWVLPAGADGAQIDLCHDRVCTSLVTSFTSAGTSGRVPRSLVAGVYFWRASAMAGGRVTSEPGMVWELFVPARGTPVDTSWGSVPDFNGDGYADVLVGGLSVDVYFGSAGGLAQTPSTSFSADSPDGFVGGPVSSAGDVNGDGFADVLKGTDVFFGGPSGPASSPSVLLLTPPTFDLSLVAAGDLDGDGFADLAGLQGTEAGLALVVFAGGPAGPASSTRQVVVTFDATTQTQTFGSAGDFDGDGFGDVVLSQYSTLDAGPPTALNVYLGGRNGPQPAAPIMNVSLQFQSLVSLDVNGDGFCDLVLPGAGANSGYGPGPLTVLFGSRGSPGQQSATVALQAPAGEELWSPLACAGDVNGDGYGDVVRAGTPFTRPVLGTIDAFVYPGGPTGLASTPTLAMRDQQSLDFGMPVAIAGAGDVNGDGLADLLIPLPRPTAGEVDVFFGSKAGQESEPNAVLVGDPDAGYFPAGIDSLP